MVEKNLIQKAANKNQGTTTTKIQVRKKMAKQHKSDHINNDCE